MSALYDTRSTPGLQKRALKLATLHHTTLPTRAASRYNNRLSNLGEILMAVFTPLSDAQVAAFLEKFDVGSFVALQGVAGGTGGRDPTNKTS